MNFNKFGAVGKFLQSTTTFIFDINEDEKNKFSIHFIFILICYSIIPLHNYILVNNVIFELK